MKNIKAKYVVLIVLIIIVLAYTLKTELGKPQVVEETYTEPIKEPEEIIEETPIETAEPEETNQNIIEIREDSRFKDVFSFYPKEKTIEKNTEIKWIKKDPRDYKLVCYLQGTRVVQSPDLKQGDSFTYTFLKEGEYTCITTPYGLRNIITVKSPAPLLSPTAGVVGTKTQSVSGMSLAVMGMMAVGILLFFNHGRKKYS